MASGVDMLPAATLVTGVARPNADGLLPSADSSWIMEALDNAVKLHESGDCCSAAAAVYEGVVRAFDRDASTAHAILEQISALIGPRVGLQLPVTAQTPTTRSLYLCESLSASDLDSAAALDERLAATAGLIRRCKSALMVEVLALASGAQSGVWQPCLVQIIRQSAAKSLLACDRDDESATSGYQLCEYVGIARADGTLAVWDTAAHTW
jgi:hypothetical protein